MKSQVLAAALLLVSAFANPSPSPSPSTPIPQQNCKVNPPRAIANRRAVSAGGSDAGAGMAPATSNAAAAAATLGPKPPAAQGTKSIWAHHMVGNTKSYKQENWASDITQAKAAGIDGFALNMGTDAWQPQSVAWAYAAAEAAGDFKVFFSFDMTSLACATDADATKVADLIKTYATNPAQAKYKDKVIVSTFSGETCAFGTAGPETGWSVVKQKSGVDYVFIPATFMTAATVQSGNWFDGQMNWDAAWPDNNQAPTTDRDLEWMKALGNKTYMASVSPFFFTYYGKDSWNKNWIYRSDDWLLATRFEQLIALRPQIDMLELLSWNDYGESHHICEVGVDQPNSQGWTADLPHTALQSLVKLYTTAFKTGEYPAFEDKVWLWSRPHPKDATPSAPTNPRPNHTDWTDDNLYALVTLTSPAQVKIDSGANSATWNLEAGLSKLSVASAVGPIKAVISRDGAEVKTVDSTGTFEYTDKPKDYNFNFVALASDEGGKANSTDSGSGSGSSADRSTPAVLAVFVALLVGVVA